MLQINKSYLYLFSVFYLFTSYLHAQHTGYDLSKYEISILPDTLREISGITIIDEDFIACVQDENGLIYMYNTEKHKIDHQFIFSVNGDYEGISKVGQSLYVLRSDGVLYEIQNYKNKKSTTQSYPTILSHSNNEGLCYDEKNNRLLIGCKTKTEKHLHDKTKRFIYAFDLKTKQYSKDPAYIFDTDSVKKFILKNSISLALPIKKKGKIAEPVFKFKMSAICIHPLNGLLYVLSASDHMLMIFNTNGKIVTVAALDPKLFNKAEGITFYKNGDMLISNEGQKGKPTLLKFLILD